MQKVDTSGRARSARRLLVMASFATCGCVLPIAPEFTDQPNLRPYIADSSPIEGTLISAIGAAGGSTSNPIDNPTISVVLADENLDDTLFFKWIVDFPPLDPNSTRVVPGPDRLPPTGRAERGRTTFTIGCNDFVRGFSRHRVMLTVADRPFENPGAHPSDAVEGGGKPTRVAWAVNLLCE